MQRPMTPINYKWTNQGIISIRFTIIIKLLSTIINSSMHL